MKQILILLLAFSCLACREKAQEKRIVQKADSLGKDRVVAMDTICFPHDLTGYTTPKGVKITYRLVENLYYFLEWEKDNQIAVLPDTFYCDAYATAQPRFEAENNKYVLMRFGCGNPCWGGIVLPLYEGGKPETLLYHLGYELDNDLIARVDFDKGEQKAMIVVKNLQSGRTQQILLEEACSSSIPTYCVDSLSIKNRVLYFKWYPETYINSNKVLEKG